MATALCLTATVSGPARFRRKLERQPVGNALGLDLDEPARFASDVGPAITAPPAGILDHHFIRAAFDHEPLTNRAGMTELDQSLAARQTHALRRGSRLASPDLPLTTLDGIEHGERRPRSHCRRGQSQQTGQGGTCKTNPCVHVTKLFPTSARTY